MATFTQRSESSPAKYDTIDSSASVRTFPRLPDTGSERGAERVTTTTTTTSTSSSKGSRVVGQEHMFHQQVGAFERGTGPVVWEGGSRSNGLAMKTAICIHSI